MLQKRIRTLYLIITDIVLVNLAFYLSYYLRFDTKVPTEFINVYLDNIIVLTTIKIVIFAYFKLYRSLWQYASIDELMQIVMGSIISNGVAIVYVVMKGSSLPRSIYVITILLDIAFIGSSRLSYRVLRRIKNDKLGFSKHEKKILIVGAGDAGAMVIKELKNHTQLASKPVAIIDDDIKKQRTRINGVPVVGQRVDIVNIAQRYNINEIIIAIPSASRKEIKSIVEECKKTNCKTKILPGMYELINGKVNINQLRDVQIEDLLGREQVKLDSVEISSYLEGKVVLVTGGGGSIGSELCRQIAKFQPRQLVILDIYENNAYDLQNELKRRYKNLNLKVLIVSVRDKARIDEVMSELRPDVVFHAAAHKHVPLMEENPKAAVKNNVFGTLNVAQAADKYEIKRFVLISTDKAVNPTNIMGATKRLCEMIIQSIDKISKTEFVAVRFGNVLGSNGSVIPLFKKQISEGGPITVTHPDIIRYFMTIPEAAQLVLQASAMAKGGEIFVLDMGEPVKIVDLAEDLIRLSGLVPYEDIQIEFTGLRPGEKLFEELLLDEEGITMTGHEKIFIGKPLFSDYKLLVKRLEKLNNLLYAKDNLIKEQLMDIVPTYKDPEHINKKVLEKSTVIEIAATESV